MFTDNLPQNGTTVYRLKIVSRKISYSNLVSLNWGNYGIKVYPNPVRDAVQISISSSIAADYEIQLLNASGQLVHKEQWKKITQEQFTYKRTDSNIQGMYVLKVINKTDNSFTVHKLLFE
jgi:hypothetical protein